MQRPGMLRPPSCTWIVSYCPSVSDCLCRLSPRKGLCRNTATSSAGTVIKAGAAVSGPVPVSDHEPVDSRALALQESTDYGWWGFLLSLYRMYILFMYVRYCRLRNKPVHDHLGPLLTNAPSRPAADELSC